MAVFPHSNIFNIQCIVKTINFGKIATNKKPAICVCQGINDPIRNTSHIFPSSRIPSYYPGNCDCFTSFQKTSPNKHEGRFIQTQIQRLVLLALITSQLSNGNAQHFTISQTTFHIKPFLKIRIVLGNAVETSFE